MLLAFLNKDVALVNFLHRIFTSRASYTNIGYQVTITKFFYGILKCYVTTIEKYILLTVSAMQAMLHHLTEKDPIVFIKVHHC